MCIECCSFGWMDFNPTWLAFALNIYDPATILQLLAAVLSYELVTFLAMLPSSSTPSVAAISTRNDGKEEGDSSDLRSRLLRQRISTLPFVYGGYESIIYSVEELGETLRW